MLRRGGALGAWLARAWCCCARAAVGPFPRLLLLGARGGPSLTLSCLLYAGAAHLADLLRDIGTAAAFLEQQQRGTSGEEDEAADSLAPSFVAAAAGAAAEYVQPLGMPALHALLCQAAAAARAAARDASCAAAVPAAEACGAKACADGEQQGGRAGA